MSVVDPNRRELVVGPEEGYFEGARWHDGALWFSDFRKLGVSRVDAAGTPTKVATVPGRPGGLGFAPDGTPMVVSIDDCSVWRIGPGGELEKLGFLGDDAIGTHDMAVDAEGRSYIAEWGYDVLGGEDPRPTGVLVRHPDGRVERQGSGLFLPNGIAVSPDGRTLVVAETFAQPHTRLTAFDIGADGLLSNQRLFAGLGPVESDSPDGLCMDVEGGVWVSFPFCGEFRRVLTGGEITDTIQIPKAEGSHCVDCALGGPEMRTLYLLIADTDMERMADNYDATSRIEAVEVDIPGPAT